MAWIHSYSLYRNKVIETQQLRHLRKGQSPTFGKFGARIVLNGATIQTEYKYDTGDEAVRALINALAEFEREES